MHRLQELVRFHRLGLSAREAARRLKMGRDTYREYSKILETAGLLEGAATEIPELAVLRGAIEVVLAKNPKLARSSSVESHGDAIVEMLAIGARPKAIFDALVLRDPDFRGSLSAVKRYCAREKRCCGPRAEDVAIPVETAPGEVAQVDFGYVGMIRDNKTNEVKRAWVFVMTLAFSRHMFAKVVFDQKLETWQRLHVDAFAYFGGVPRVIVPDNLKAAIVRASFGVDDEATLTRSYRELARHYGFLVDPAPPRAPKKKGKVEASVKYVKRNFFLPRQDLDVESANRELLRWTLEIAGQRIHGTTWKRPLEVFESLEKPVLLPLPRDPFEVVTWRTAKVHQDSHVAFCRRLYSVPWTHIGREVWIRATSSTLAIYCDDERVATHPRSGSGDRSTNDLHLPDHRKDLRHRRREQWEERAAQIGEDVLAYVRAAFDQDDVLLRLRVVQAVVTHLEPFPKDRANRACARALAYGNFKVGAIKTILRNALDLEPLDETEPPIPSAKLEAPRFARSIAELVLNNMN
jgi:transposase